LTETRTPVTKNLTTTEAAERLGITVGTLANWRVQGVGPNYLKVGLRRVMYPEHSLTDFERRSLVEVGA
jgi:hypothetical protein